jgi:hypothetical protein
MSIGIEPDRHADAVGTNSKKRLFNSDFCEFDELVSERVKLAFDKYFPTIEDIIQHQIQVTSFIFF